MTEKSEYQVIWACVKCGSYMIDEYRLEDKGGHWPMYTKSFICDQELKPYFSESQYLALKSDLAVAVEGLKDVVEIWENDCKGSGPDTMTGEWLYNKAKEALERIGVK